MADIDLETVTPSASDATDHKVVRRGASPYSVELVPDGPLGLHDWWTEQVFTTTDIAQGSFLGAAITSGTNNGALGATYSKGYNPHGVLLRSSASSTASGYRYMTGGVVGDRFGVQSRKFTATVTYISGQMRLGFFDQTGIADVVDGCCFTRSGGTDNYGLCVTNTSSATLTTDFQVYTAGETYTFDIEVNAAATECRFRIYEGTNTTPVLEEVVTTNIPTGTARLFGAGMQIWGGNGTAVTDLCILHRMGFGTIEAFKRARG